MLVANEYRYIQTPSLTASAEIKARFDKSVVIERATNLDVAGAQALADDLAKLTTKRVLTFTIVVEGIITPKDFIGGAPRYLLNLQYFPGAGNSVYTVVGAKVDHLNNQTTLTVRGS